MELSGLITGIGRVLNEADTLKYSLIQTNNKVLFNTEILKHKLIILYLKTMA